MISIISELAFGVFLFLASLILIPRLLSGDKKIYEIAVPFGVILIISTILFTNFNLSIIIATVSTGIIYYIRKSRR